MPAADDILERLLRDLRRAVDGPAIVREAEVRRLVGEAELAYGKARLGIVRDERPVSWFVDHLLGGGPARCPGCGHRFGTEEHGCTLAPRVPEPEGHGGDL